MAQRKDITTGVQTVTATGAVTGSLDTSALTGDFTLKAKISGLEAGKTAIVAIEDTANATPFSDAIQVASFHVIGPVTAEADLVFTWRKYQVPGTRFGAANTKLRFNVTSLTGSSNLKIEGWLEQ